MALLLDTHVFVWLDLAPQRLSRSAREMIQNPQNILYLSIASVWELQIKLQLGKLKLNATLETTLAEQRRVNNLQLLAIEANHILQLSELPALHHDPFDRLLITQTRSENLTLVTDDALIHSYPVNWVW